MKKLGLLIALWAPMMLAQAAPKAAPADPLAAVAWMAGAWHGEIQAPGGEVTRVDMQLKRTLGGHVIAFDTSFNGSLQYEGQFAYDAVRKQIVFAYGGADGGWVEGNVQPQPEYLLWDFNVHESDGSSGHYQVHVHQDGADDFTWALFRPNGDGWAPMFQIKYHRVTG
jgi:hypothetical protein